MKLFIAILLSVLVGSVASAKTEVTVITDTDFKTITEESVTSQKKLTDKVVTTAVENIRFQEKSESNWVYIFDKASFTQLLASVNL